MNIRSPEDIADHKVRIIKQCIRETTRNPEFRNKIIQLFPDANFSNIVQKLWQFQYSLIFSPEQGKGDYCKDGLELLRDRHGDCEDFSVFNSAVLHIFGVQHRIKVMDTRGKGYYTHILLEYYNPRAMQWRPFDGTYRTKGLGGEPKHGKQKRYQV